jgi:hypothetical protein
MVFSKLFRSENQKYLVPDLEPASDHLGEKFACKEFLGQLSNSSKVN